MHRALSSDTDDPAFAREPVSQQDIVDWAEAVRTEADRAFGALDRLDADLDEATSAAVERLRQARGALDKRIAELAQTPPTGSKIRIHGDYHLGQVLVSKDDVVIIDFEGEPGRSLQERRQKNSPLRDLAGMLRSIDYAAFAALDRLAARMPEHAERIVAAAESWRKRASDELLQIYRASAEGMPGHPDDRDATDGQLELFLLLKAFYEIGYEAGNRPGWLSIPVRGVLDLIAKGSP
jgi:maltose alpha-D-glucosyltransferase/alpha-amylase